MIEAGKLELGARVANGLVSEGSATTAPVLMDYCDRLLAGSRVEEALSVWNGLSRHGLIPFAGLDPAGAVVLTNGDFSKEPTSRGFDWRTPAVEGVSLLRDQAAGGLRVIFSGEQPENCSPLAQTVPVEGVAGMLSKFPTAPQEFRTMQASVGRSYRYSRLRRPRSCQS